MDKKLGVLVTGASGFIGSSVTQYLHGKGYSLVPCFRPGATAGEGNRSGCRSVFWDMESSEGAEAIFQDVSVVVHCAGRAHIDESGSEALRQHLTTNRDLTLNLARRSANYGVKRFVFISTVGVLGPAYEGMTALVESSISSDLEPYAYSKLSAEKELFEISESSDMEVVVIRPCLVVGPGAPGNISKLVRLMAREIPIPLPRRKNSRSYCSLESLNELIRLCLEHPAASGETFIAADTNQISTEEVMKSLCRGLDVQFRPVRLPPSLLKFGFFCLGRSGLYNKLYGDFVVDASHAAKQLEWFQSPDSKSAFELVGRSSRTTNY